VQEDPLMTPVTIDEMAASHAAAASKVYEE
jgi:hypothetical protein